MAKLHFFYSTMNAGKSTLLLQANHNYIENDHKTLLFIPQETALKYDGNIVSRIGLKAKATVANKNFNYFDYVNKHRSDDLSCILVDEAQFLSKKQVRELGKIADELNYPVMCYGIRTDFQGELFEGSSELLAISDNLIELKTICAFCNRKATMVVRTDDKNNIITEGNKVEIGGNEINKSVSRKHFRELTGLI